MAANWMRRTALVAACASAALLAACGSGSIESALKPEQLITFGDGYSFVREQRYTVNNGTVNNWTLQLLDHYQKSGSATGGLVSFAEGNTRIAQHPDAAGNATTPTITEQVASFSTATVAFTAADTRAPATFECSLDGAGFVSYIAAFFQGGAEQAVAEHLRRLRLPQAIARLGGGHALFGIRPLQRVGYRHRENAANRVLRQVHEQRIEHGGGNAGPGGIVHQHPVIVGCHHGGSLQAVGHALRPRRAATAHRFQLGTEFTPVVARPPGVVRGQHDPHPFDVRTGGQRLQGMKNQRATEQVEVLLGLLGAEAGTAAGSGNDCVMAWHGLILLKNDKN